MCNKLNEGYKLFLQQTNRYDIQKDELIELRCPNDINSNWSEKKDTDHCCCDCYECWGEDEYIL